MSFNYGYERRRMEREFAKKAEQCRAEKMPEENIAEFHRHMLDELNSNRRFYTHTQSLDNYEFADGEQADESSTPLLTKYIERLSVYQCEISEWGRLDWIQDINDPQLAEWIKTLSEEDIEFLTLIFVDELKQNEVASLRGCSEAAVSKKKSRLLKNAKKFLSKG